MSDPAKPRGGRPNAFGDEPTERLNVMLPAGMVRAIRQQALEGSRTPGQVVASKLGATYLAVTFRQEKVMAYADVDSAEARTTCDPHFVPGYLTLDTAGYHHFMATDDQGHSLDLNQFSPMVHPRASTTVEALTDLVGKLPGELYASKFPAPP